MRGKIIQLSEADIVQRALSQCGRSVIYGLQYPNGGTDPEAAGPEDPPTKRADCIGFADWAAGFDRAQHGKFPDTPSVSGGSINTDSMIEEARLHGKWFTIHPAPVRGGFIVGHTFTREKPVKKKVIGHIGVTVDVDGYAEKGLPGIQVVHCSPSNYAYTAKKSAIWKTTGAIWASYPDLCFITFNRDYAMGLK